MESNRLVVQTPVYKATDAFSVCVRCGCYITDFDQVVVGQSVWHRHCREEYENNLARLTAKPTQREG